MALGMYSIEKTRAGQAASSVASWVQGLFGHTDFSTEAEVVQKGYADPRLMPRVPMSSSEIDVHFLNELGKLGLRRGKLVTDQSHPELMQAWREINARVGYTQTPQLIVTESDMPNAFTVKDEGVVVTTGLMKLLNLRELTAALSHEMAHESSNHKKPRMIASMVFGGAGLFGGEIAASKLPVKRFFERTPILRLAYYAVAAFIGMTVGLVVANQVAVRPTELDADRKGAMISGDPEGLISALTKMQSLRPQPTLASRWKYLQSGYPTMETRIDNLRKIAANGVPRESVIEHVTPAQAPNQPVHSISNVVVSSRLEAPQPAATLGLN